MALSAATLFLGLGFGWLAEAAGVAAHLFVG